MGTIGPKSGIRLAGIGVLRGTRPSISGTSYDLAGPEASLVPGPGPSIRVQLVHPYDPGRFVLLDVVWDRQRDEPNGRLLDLLRIRGWASHPLIRIPADVRGPGARLVLIRPDRDAAPRWEALDRLPPGDEGNPPPGSPHVAVWIPAPLAGAVQEWVQALGFERVPSELAAAMATLMEGFFGEGGVADVQRGLAQLRGALTGSGVVQ